METGLNKVNIKKIAAVILAVLCFSSRMFVTQAQIIDLTEKSKIVELETTYNNIRDLGGYKTTDGKVTKHGVFYRSEELNTLTQNDIEKLQQIGITTIIDFRSGDRVFAYPDKIVNNCNFKYYNLQIFATNLMHEKHIHAEDQASRTELLTKWVASDFIQVIFKTTFNIFAETEGPILFHCASGRHKTGLVAALLLGLVNVSDEIIQNHFVYSFENIAADRKKQIKNNIIPDFSIVINYIKENYSTTENYLLACGVSQENLDKIKNKFVGEI